MILAYSRRMRVALIAAVFALQTGSAVASVCVTSALDMRRASLVAVARYAGHSVFTVESILRTAGDRPSRIVAPEGLFKLECAPPEPEVAGLYVVALYPEGRFGYREYAQASYERELVEQLHVVDAKRILEALQSYSNGAMGRDETRDWLHSALVEPRLEDSFTEMLLETAESLLNSIVNSEACNKDLIRSLRTEELPAALRVIAPVLPSVDTEKEFVRRRAAGVNDDAQRALVSDEALNEWQDMLYIVRDALDPMQTKLVALPWCDHEKYGP
jgi:hypothetical protein